MNVLGFQVYLEILKATAYWSKKDFEMWNADFGLINIQSLHYLSICNPQSKIRNDICSITPLPGNSSTIALIIAYLDRINKIGLGLVRQHCRQ